jgi:predicted nuclease of predicted toxin-antitoxin system
MAIPVKVDENLPADVRNLLKGRGYDAVNVLDQGMGGTSDDELWQTIQQEGRFLVTGDKGFADIRKFRPGRDTGIILLRPRRSGRQPVVELTQQLLDEYELGDLASKLVVVSPSGIRIHQFK